MVNDQKVRRQKLYDRHAEDGCLRIMGVSAFTRFVSEQLRMLQDVLGQFHDIITGLNEVCFMKDDDEQSILEICQIIDDIMSVYKQLMAFIRKIYAAKTDEIFSGIMAVFWDLGEQLCVNVIDQLSQKCTSAQKSLEEYLVGNIQEEDLNLSIHLDINENTDRLMKKLHAFGKNP